VYGKLDEFAKSKLVITDRLHGMIFSAITGTPCIVFANSNGKVEAEYQWIQSLPYIRFVSHIGEFAHVMKKIDIEKKYHFWDYYGKSILDRDMEPLTSLVASIKEESSI
jgi:pyruvyl transferase EpsI